MSNHETRPADLPARLRQNPYPGRGIVLGLTPDGSKSWALYFIMGRSVNSRNRVFIREEGGLRIEPYDPALVSDPSLIVYRPVRTHGQQLIVTNGDQTDTIFDALAAGGSFEAALRTRTFEPDAPNYTPRISGLVDLDTGDYRLSILKAADAAGTACLRCFYEVQARPGIGHFIHTYQGDGNPLPSYAGEPTPVSLPDDLQAYADSVWQSLDADNKVALYAQETDLKTGESRHYLYNRHGAR